MYARVQCTGRLFFEIKMAALWGFEEITDEDLLKFSKGNENENTVKKNEYDLRVFRDYLLSINEQREIETLKFSELSFCIEMKLNSNFIFILVCYSLSI